MQRRATSASITVVLNVALKWLCWNLQLLAQERLMWDGLVAIYEEASAGRGAGCLPPLRVKPCRCRGLLMAL